MFLQINLISERLQQYNIENFLINSGNAYIRAAKLLKPNQTDFQPEVLYIGKASYLTENLPEDRVLNFLCMDDSGISPSLENNKSLNILICYSNMDVLDIFNIVQDVLLGNYYFLQSSAALLNSIIRGKGLQYIMEIGRELLGNPVMLGDSNHRLLAYSKGDSIVDPAWNEFIDKGYCTYEYTEKYGFKKWIEKQVNSKSPVIGDLGEMGNTRRIFAKIAVGDNIVGHLAVLENNKPFSERDLEITAFLCDVISSEMQKNSRYCNTRSVMLENLILDLLDGSLNNEEAILKKVRQLNWKMKDRLYILSIKYSNYEDTFPLISYIREALSVLIEENEAVFYDNHIIFIISCDKDKFLKKDDFAGLIEFLNKNSLYAGLSQCFTKISDLRKYYKQSLSSISLGQKIHETERFYMYEHYAVYNIVDICCQQQDITGFCHPALLTLQAYDERHNTSYVKSLYSYIVNMRNVISTSDALHIHRNTMSYRITKIQEITGIDLESDDLAMNLFVSFKILEYSGKIFSTAAL